MVARGAVVPRGEVGRVPRERVGVVVVRVRQRAAQDTEKKLAFFGLFQKCLIYCKVLRWKEGLSLI